MSLVGVALHTPQLRHLERFADLLVTAPRRKTLAQLAAQELDGVDASNRADFFRISPWEADDLRRPLLDFIFRYLQQHPERQGLPRYFTLDDSLTPKDKGTHCLQGVDGHFDPNQKRTIRGGGHVVLGIQGGDFPFPLTWRLYLRESTVRRLNQDKRRHGKPRRRYRSKLDLAREMLQQLSSSLPAKNSVYVRFDAWYTSAQLVKGLRPQGWPVIGAVKSNRQRSGPKLTDRHRARKGRSYDQVSLELANQQRRTYGTRTLTGRVRDVPGAVRVVISQRGPGVRTPKYFLCTDTTLSAQEIWTRYQQRWRQEVDYWYVKLPLGLGDFRLQSYEVIAKWYAVVYLVRVYWYWQRYEHAAHHGASTRLSEVLARIRQDHQREVLRAACEEVARGASVAEVVERYVGPPTAPAA